MIFKLLFGQAQWMNMWSKGTLAFAMDDADDDIIGLEIKLQNDNDKDTAVQCILENLVRIYVECIQSASSEVTGNRMVPFWFLSKRQLHHAHMAPW